MDHGDKTDSTVILTSLVVDVADDKEVPPLAACTDESKEGRLSVLEDLIARKTTQIDFIVTD